MNLRPTNRCFDDALDFLSELIRRGQTREAFGMVLVHGICRMPRDAATPNERYAHAWVEAGAQVIQAALLDGERVFYSMPWETFCVVFRPENPVNVTRYTLEQAWRENEKHLTYGPWEERYLELTRGAKRRRQGSG